MKILKKFFKKEKGQSMVEFALILPILLLILCGIIDFGWLFYNQLSVDNACRDATRYSVVNSTDADLEAELRNKIKVNIGSLFVDDFDVDIHFTDPITPRNGDVTITVTANMKVLTPVLGTISGGQERALTSKVTMKVES